ncbi:MAG TPA: acyl-CoA dehydrogenase family protein [Actinomycetes bacterium]|nr:acyl-CoA dehydrogenase family protein [Actinomycetes bacterium]
MRSETHQVFNQTPPLAGYDAFAADHCLVESITRAGPEDAVADLADFGRLAGSAEAQQWAADANAYPPVLRSHDRYGHRIDEVDFHSSWHRLMEVSVGHGLHAYGSGAHLLRAARFYLWSQVEAGHGCPISMTYAAVPALRAEPALAAEWEPLLAARDYRPGLDRTAAAKGAALVGMGMTEKQGGSDVRANTTRAVPAGDGSYLLTGHKWFCSAPMCDAFLVLAQAPGGLTCFLLPRVRPDGTRNTFLIQRLKDKLGNRSNASAEVEFDSTYAVRVGAEGRGVATIIAMVAATRLDCVLGSAALMRQALVQAVHHARYRHAFGAALVDQPLMTNVLADLALESAAATTLAMRLAAAVDTGEDDLLRLGVAVGKYWVCKRGPAVTAETLECLGGNGYVEESGMPRLYREAPLNSIWEGAGNVNALDVVRALRREPAVIDAYLREVGTAAGADRHLDGAVKDLLQSLADLDGVEAGARRLVERMALLLQGALLVRHAPAEVADAFCESRLGQDWGHAFGTLPGHLDHAALVERAFPAGAAEG